MMAQEYHDRDYSWADHAATCGAAYDERLRSSTTVGATSAAEQFTESDGQSWQDFHERQGDMFFKPKRYLLRAMPELAEELAEGASSASSSSPLILELGCGSGSSIIPHQSGRLYRRSDGTLSFFFDAAYLDSLFLETGFSAVRPGGYCTIRSINRKTGQDLKRVWIQGIYRRSQSDLPPPLAAQLLSDHRRNRNREQQQQQQQQQSDGHGIRNSDEWDELGVLMSYLRMDRKAAYLVADLVVSGSVP
eukprot:g3053.t1